MQHVKIDSQVEILAVDFFDAGDVQAVLAIITKVRSAVFKDAKAIVTCVYREDLSKIGRCEQRNDPGFVIYFVDSCGQVIEVLQSESKHLCFSWRFGCQYVEDSTVLLVSSTVNDLSFDLSRVFFSC